MRTQAHRDMTQRRSQTINPFVLNISVGEEVILSDFDLENFIRGKRLVIKPFLKDTIRENGVDLRLDNQIGRHNENVGDDFVLDPSKQEHINLAFKIEKNQKQLFLKGRSQVLLSTKEYIKLPNDLMGFVELRSTWARHGLALPPTIIDAGFEGNVTLEVLNNAPYPILLKPGVRFAHVIFAATMNQVKNIYNGKVYQGQRGVKLPKVINE